MIFMQYLYFWATFLFLCKNFDFGTKFWFLQNFDFWAKFWFLNFFDFWAKFWILGNILIFGQNFDFELCTVNLSLLGEIFPTYTHNSEVQIQISWANWKLDRAGLNCLYCLTDGWMDGRTDGWTDRRTEQDNPLYLFRISIISINTIDSIVSNNIVVFQLAR